MACILNLGERIGSGYAGTDMLDIKPLAISAQRGSQRRHKSASCTSGIYSLPLLARNPNLYQNRNLLSRDHLVLREAP